MQGLINIFDFDLEVSFLFIMKLIVNERKLRNCEIVCKLIQYYINAL